MILEALIVAGVAVGALTSFGVARTVVRARRTPARPPTLGEVLAPRGPRGLKERDVLNLGRDSVVLEPGLELDESGLVLRAFRALGTPAEWVLQLDVEARDIALGAACTEVPDGAVPEALPIGGRTLRVRRRGTGRVQATGTSPAPFTLAHFVLLDERGGRVLIVLDPQPTGARLAIAAERIDLRSVDILQGGDVPDSTR